MKKALLLTMALLMIVLASSVACTSGARFEVVSLDVAPSEVPAGETVTITANVTNTGGSEGTFNATLTVDGLEAATKNVTVAPGSTEVVTFALTKDEAGTYETGLGELTSTFTVVELQEIELKYDDGVARDWLSSGGGYLIDFVPPETPFTIKTVRIFGALFGSGWEGQKFDVEIWDNQRTALHASVHEVTLFIEWPPATWVDIEVPDVEVLDRFYVHVWTGTGRLQGIHVGADDSVLNEHSNGTTSTYRGIEEWAWWPYHPSLWFGDKSKVNWMIRVLGTTSAPAD